jgi:FkbM family methyltransferase
MARFQMQSKDEIEISSRAGARAVYLGSHTILCRTLDSYLIYLDARDYGIVPHLAMDGFWESWVTLAASRLVEPGMRVVNVGASFGYYAVLFADLVGPLGEVVAFEPLAPIAEQLERTRAANQFAHLRIRREVVLEEHKMVRFATTDGYLNGYALGEGEQLEAPGTVVKLRAAPLDELVEGPVDLVFIDAEGAEPDVWSGMQNTVHANPRMTIVLEFTRGRYGAPLHFARMLGRGRTLSVIDENGALLPRTPEELAAGDSTGLPAHWTSNVMVVARP